MTDSKAPSRLTELLTCDKCGIVSPSIKEAIEHRREAHTANAVKKYYQTFAKSLKSKEQ